MFDSVLVSFAAVRYWTPKQGTSVLVGDNTSITCRTFIYDCQIVVLVQVLAKADEDRDANFDAMMIDIRDRWLLNGM